LLEGDDRDDRHRRAGAVMDAGGDSPRDAGLGGRYANYFEIGHNAFEFLLDFGQQYADRSAPETRRVELHTRIIAGPVYAKVLLALLEASVTEHEQRFGVIPTRGEEDGDDAPSVG
jgi:hypothetical protein